MVKFGVRNGVQRYQCRVCKVTRSDSPENPLVNLRVPFEKAVQVVSLLCESNGIRACERLTGLNRRTVLNILDVAGQKALAVLDDKIRNVNAEFVQVDEIHTFVQCKAYRTTPYDLERGDFFTYLSVDRASKLIINWHTSKRNNENTLAFLNDLKARVRGHFQLTTDAFAGYVTRGSAGGVRNVFGNTIDHATEVKIFGRETTNPWFSRNPLTVIGIKRQARLGNPDMSMATTCHAERTNLSVRTFTRRFTRCTLGYSKTLENLRHAVALFVAHFNFCRVHSAHGRTPAQAAGLTDHAWKVDELLNYSIS
jgi:IS1 family transposase